IAGGKRERNVCHGTLNSRRAQPFHVRPGRYHIPLRAQETPETGFSLAPAAPLRRLRAGLDSLRVRNPRIVSLSMIKGGQRAGSDRQCQHGPAARHRADAQVMVVSS
ncbi:MAG: hypothetical protein OXI66_18660, partial [Boseongicola sp.]|nr:hypothetical protein [Boseongicola sp.]